MIYNAGKKQANLYAKLTTNMYGHMDWIDLNMNIGSIRFANRF